MSESNKHITDAKKDKLILDAVSRFSVTWKVAKDKAWDKVSAQLHEVPTGKRVFLIPVFKVAAAITIVAVAVLGMYRNQRVEIITQNAEQRLVYLPDSSSVRMNAASRLVYNSMFWSKNRKIDFTGEGFFNIRKKNGSFNISSSNGHTKVLGTSFNLIARDNIYKVACVSGKVYVTSRSKASDAILTAGLSVEQKTNTLTAPHSFNQKTTVAWQFGEFYFESAGLNEVVAELERQYNVEVVLNVEDTKRIYTTYFTNTDLNEALQLVCVPIGLNFEIKADNKIIITDQKLNV